VRSSLELAQAAFALSAAFTPHPMDLSAKAPTRPAAFDRTDILASSLLPPEILARRGDSRK
jgi:hypothetical protein